MSENIKIKSDEISTLARGQAVVEARSKLENECRILSASCSAVTVPSEVFAGEARYMGKVNFDCLVLVDNRIECVSTVAEFSDKITAPEIAAGMNVTLVPEVVNIEASIEGDTLKAVAVVDTSATAAVGNEYNCLAEPDDGIYAEKRTVNYCTVCAEQSESVYITDSVSAAKITDIICTSSRAVVTGAESAEGEVKVSGAVYTNIVVRTDDDTVTTSKVVTPFVKSISALGVSEGNIAFATASITEASATLVEGDNRIDIAITMNIGVTAVDCRQTEAVADVFCADNEIEPKTAEAKCCAVEPMVTVIDTVDGQIPIPADKLAADNVLCVTGTFCNLSSATVTDKRVTVEGLVGGDIIYYNAEKNDVDTIAFRLPFSMPLSAHTDAQDVSATATVTDVTVRIRRESVFDIKAEVAFTLRFTSGSSCTVVESVGIGAAIERPNASVIVHIAKAGETLWQAAKALCCSPERVQQQNDAPAPYSGGERLINFCNK